MILLLCHILVSGNDFNDFFLFSGWFFFYFNFGYDVTLFLILLRLLWCFSKVFVTFLDLVLIWLFVFNLLTAYLCCLSYLSFHLFYLIIWFTLFRPACGKQILCMSFLMHGVRVVNNLFTSLRLGVSGVSGWCSLSPEFATRSAVFLSELSVQVSTFAGKWQTTTAFTPAHVFHTRVLFVPPLNRQYCLSGHEDCSLVKTIWIKSVVFFCAILFDPPVLFTLWS